MYRALILLPLLFGQPAITAAATPTEIAGLLITHSTDFQEISLGKTDGVSPGMVFSVTKDGIVMAQLEVVAVLDAHKSKTEFLEGGRVVFIEVGLAVSRARDQMVEDNLLQLKNKHWQGLRFEEIDEVKKFTGLPRISTSVATTEWIYDHLSWHRNYLTIVSDQLTIATDPAQKTPELAKNLVVDQQLLTKHVRKLEKGRDLLVSLANGCEDIAIVTETTHSPTNNGLITTNPNGQTAVSSSSISDNEDLKQLVSTAEAQISLYLNWLEKFTAWQQESDYSQFIVAKREKFGISAADLPIDQELDMMDQGDEDSFDESSFAPVRFD